MKHAIELFFDPETEKKLFRLAALVEKEGLSTRYMQWKTRPHLTLACYNDADEARCGELLDRFAARRFRLPVCIGSVGMFPDTKTIFASPVMTAGMYRLQRELHEALAGFDTAGHAWYLPDRWVPHCALALMQEDGPEAFYRACDLVLRHFEKMDGTFEAIGLVRITCPVQEIHTAALRPAEEE